jgi:ATP/maltotriose-dependent transcriptional regulator MalT
VNAEEEGLYEALLEHPGASVTSLAELSHHSRRTVRRLLKALGLKGMVSHSPDRDSRYFPTPPDVAMDALIAKRMEELQNVRIASARLRQKARKNRNAGKTEERLVEIVTGREAQAAVFTQIQNGAQSELIAIDRPPYVVAPSGINQAEIEMMGRGVRCRGVYGRAALEIPDAIQRIETCVKAGEKARVFETVPLKLIGADHRVAMLPLDLRHLEDAALLVRECSLLDSLYELFETIWARATPIAFRTERVANKKHPIAKRKFDRIIPLLASGLNDKRVADQLDVSTRTLDRHIKNIMLQLDAHTRFQAGWLAAFRAFSEKDDN